MADDPTRTQSSAGSRIWVTEINDDNINNNDDGATMQMRTYSIAYTFRAIGVQFVQ